MKAQEVLFLSIYRQNRTGGASDDEFSGRTQKDCSQVAPRLGADHQQIGVRLHCLFYDLLSGSISGTDQAASIASLLGDGERRADGGEPNPPSRQRAV